MSDQREESEDQKKTSRMNIIYNALEDGWTVKKLLDKKNTYEFVRSNLIETEWKGLFIISTKSNTLEEIGDHITNINKIRHKNRKKIKSFP